MGGRQGRLQGHGAVVHVPQEAEATALVEATGDLGDVRGRVAVAEIGGMPRLAGLGDDRPMALLVELVDHDPVITGQVLEDPDRRIPQGGEGQGPGYRLEGVLDEGPQVGGGGGQFQFDDQPPAGGAMEGAIEGHVQAGDLAAHGDGQGVQGFRQPRADPGGQVAAQGRQGQAEDGSPQSEKGRGIGAGLDDDQFRFRDHQQGAMGLDGTGQVDLFPLAIGQVGLAEAGRNRRKERFAAGQGHGGSQRGGVIAVRGGAGSWQFAVGQGHGWAPAFSSPSMP